VYEDHAELLATSKPDFVAIATESGIHAQITLDAIAAGCHVLTEKPMSLSTADSTRMIDAAASAGKTLGVCFQNRFNAPIQKLKTAVDAGRFGGFSTDRSRSAGTETRATTSRRPGGAPGIRMGGPS
jgi:UDP-N-acetyl-2-amino-2-deoxyglucuronate dehydrogenase